MTAKSPTTWEKIALALIALVTAIVGGSKAIGDGSPHPVGMSESQVRVIATEVSEKTFRDGIQTYDQLSSTRYNQLNYAIGELKVLIINRDAKDDSRYEKWAAEFSILRDRVRTLELIKKNK